jgi:hypothetical protein
MAYEFERVGTDWLIGWVAEQLKRNVEETSSDKDADLSQQILNEFLPEKSDLLIRKSVWIHLRIIFAIFTEGIVLLTWMRFLS